MRKEFWKELYETMKGNDQVYCLVGDLGYIGADRIRDEFPKRFVNTGASEFAMMGIAAGLALEGKIPVVYTITPFLLYRPFEMIRTYINKEKIPVILIGSGRNDDYKHDGYSHYAGDDKGILSNLGNIYCSWPDDADEMKNQLKIAIDDRTQATYINLARG